MDKDVKLNLRLPPREHRRLKQAAEASCRSLQREILFRLRQSLACSNDKAAA
jgi:predicted HicB family RNase H-like nuclease